MWCDVWLCVIICETFCMWQTLIQGLSRWYRDSGFLWISGVLQVTYNDVELLLFNYMLLMVVIKACVHPYPTGRSWWHDGGDACLACFHVAMNTLFSSFYDLCSKFKVIWKDEIFEANFYFYKFGMWLSPSYCCTYYNNYVLFSTCTLWQPAQENTILSPKTDPLWPLSNSKVSSCR
jgi:hypothetical protein